MIEHWNKLPKKLVKSPFGDTQKPTRHNPEESADLADLALSRRPDWVISRGPFLPQLLCSSAANVTSLKALCNRFVVFQS